jgi:hypothetical protein
MISIFRGHIDVQLARRNAAEDGFVPEAHGCINCFVAWRLKGISMADWGPSAPLSSAAG